MNRTPVTFFTKNAASHPLWKNLAVILLLVGSFALCQHLIAQSFSVDWYKVSGGGGISTGGTYQVSGTIGQHDARGPMSGGAYSLTSGFWAFIQVVQTPGSPVLKIVPAGPGQATISWTPNTPGFVLQETTSISPTNWVNSPSGRTNAVTVPASAPARFYRLAKP